MKRALIVDDDKNVTQTLKLWFENSGFEVQIAESGGEALEAFESADFDVILLDLHLPDISGQEIFQQLSTKQPVIVMSGDPLHLDEFPLKIAKPFRPKELMSFLEEIL